MGLMLRGPDFLLSAAVILIPGFLLFRLRMMGAGDGKLMAVIAGYLGVWQGLQAIAAGLAVGAVWSFWIMCRGKCFRVRLKHLMDYSVMAVQTGQAEPYDSLEAPDGEGRIPLATCLAVGGVLYLLQFAGHL